MVLKMILSANTSSKSATGICAVRSRSAIQLKVGLVNVIFFQLRNEGLHNVVTVLLGVESLREKKNGSDYAPTRHSNPNIIFSSCSGDSLNACGLCTHQTREFSLFMYPYK